MAKNGPNALGSFAGGFVGSLSGSMAGQAVGEGLDLVISQRVTQAASYLNTLDGLAQQRQTLADYDADYYGYTNGTYNPNLNAAGRTLYDGQTEELGGNITYHGHIEYGPTAFEYPSLLQAVGANESWKLNALQEGQWLIAGGQLANGPQLEMGAEAWTINNAGRLNLTPLAVNIMIQQYNHYAGIIGAGRWGE